MRSRLTILGTFLLASIAMLATVGDGNQALAGDWSCKLSPSCTNTAQCTGDKWARTGDCAISCYKESSAPGEIVFAGSANCAATSGGGGGGGTRPGGSLEDFDYTDGEYCAENYWWDFNCSGPDDTYRP